ncbi:hypothetical protein C6495_00460, partial [Candidatus Poribacteria bacterium]
RKRKPIISVGDGTNYFQFLASRDAGVAFAAVLGKTECFGEIYNLVHPQPRTWDEWQAVAAEVLGVSVEFVHVAQDTLIAMDAQRYSGLRGNFGHTQIYSGAKLATVLPEFKPRTPVTESVAENIAWMDKHNRVPNSDEDELEDRIIETIQNLSL